LPGFGMVIPQQCGLCAATEDWELQGDERNPWELWAAGPRWVPTPCRHSGLWVLHRWGGRRDYKCLLGNASPTCVRAFSSTGGSFLTSRYPQGDAARMGAPGEKGPNGLPVSMAAGAVPSGRCGSLACAQ